MEGIGFDRGVSKKHYRMEGHPHAPTLGNPVTLTNLEKLIPLDALKMHFWRLFALNDQNKC